MHECTVPDGEAPHTLVTGNPEKEYILGIDPSFSNSPSSDYFAMSLLELDEGSYTLVHSYAVAGGDLKNHIKYLFYLYKNYQDSSVFLNLNSNNYLKLQHYVLYFVFDERK